MAANLAFIRDIYVDYFKREPLITMKQYTPVENANVQMNIKVIGAAGVMDTKWYKDAIATSHTKEQLRLVIRDNLGHLEIYFKPNFWKTKSSLLNHFSEFCEVSIATGSGFASSPSFSMEDVKVLVDYFKWYRQTKYKPVDASKAARGFAGYVNNSIFVFDNVRAYQGYQEWRNEERRTGVIKSTIEFKKFLKTIEIEG